MSEICNHPKSLNLPTQYSKIYKDECTLCFDSQDSDCGINVCLTCFNGSCISNSHTNLHFNKTNHPLVVNIKRIKKVRDPGTPPPQKLTKIEIKAENEADLYEFVTKPICLPCGNVEINRSEGNINAVIESVLNSLSAKKQSEIKAWEEDITSCKHTKEVVQEENVQLSNHAQAHCVNCELKENLWLCLTCGNLACGRQQYGIIVFDILLTKVGGMGGNGHGLQHFEQAGHSVAVKLGTITPEGQADVFCYSCGEERLDPLLGQHLGNIGIKIADQQKTEKTLTELQVEQNLKFDFSMATEDGKTFTPLFGSGLTGLKNLGNTCYMASVLQTLFSISKFQDRYINLSKSHHEHCGSIPAECFHCQICKLADGLLSGRYSSREKQVTTTEEGKEVIIQQGISPSMFKNLIGKGHPEFSTMKQQDSQDYLTHLLSIIEQKENNNIANPTKIFNVSFEQKLQCLECLNVKYTSSAETGILHLFMNTKNNDEKESIKFEDCLDDYFSESRSEGWNCPRDKKPTTCVKSNKFQKFPEVIVFVMKRFVISENYVMKKLNSPLEVPFTLNLDAYRAKGIQENEEILPEDTASSEPAFNEELLNQLLQMGFPEIRCKKGLLATGNTSADSAMNWLFEHMDDADIDHPIIPNNNAGSQNFDENDVNSLVEMGFSNAQAKKALKETGNNVERAVTWLFSHTGDPMLEDDQLSSKTSNSVEIDSKPANYQLFSFISHKGTSTSCGHYVSHTLKVIDGKKVWVLFNDEKVVLVPEKEIQKSLREGYLYFYRRI